MRRTQTFILRSTRAVNPVIAARGARAQSDQERSLQSGPSPAKRPACGSWKILKARATHWLKMARRGVARVNPGNPAAWVNFCVCRRTKSATNKNSPPQRVVKVRGATENSLTLATGSTVGRGCCGRSSSSRRGNGANPSVLRTSRNAGRAQWALAILQNLADLINGWWFCLRNLMIRSRAADFLGWV